MVKKMIDEQDLNNWRGDIEDMVRILQEEIKKLEVRLGLLEKK